jgi:ligand-binding SRPBCC domain-containing protein
MSYTDEQIVGGVMSGLITLGQEVEWQARHFGLLLKLRVQITAIRRPNYFRDTMVKGLFRRFEHEHTFTEQDGGTLMADRLSFESPVPVLGKLFDILVLGPHLKHLLKERNRVIKSVAETEKWHKYLSSPKS